jgi:hypothetical protein
VESNRRKLGSGEVERLRKSEGKKIRRLEAEKVRKLGSLKKVPGFISQNSGCKSSKGREQIRWHPVTMALSLFRKLR